MNSFTFFSTSDFIASFNANNFADGNKKCVAITFGNFDAASRRKKKD